MRVYCSSLKQWVLSQVLSLSGCEVRNPLVLHHLHFLITFELLFIQLSDTHFLIQSQAKMEVQVTLALGDAFLLETV